MRLVSVRVLSLKDLLQRNPCDLSGAGLSFHLHSSRHTSKVWERDVNSRPLVVSTAAGTCGDFLHPRPCAAHVFEVGTLVIPTSQMG